MARGVDAGWSNYACREIYNQSGEIMTINKVRQYNERDPDWEIIFIGVQYVQRIVCKSRQKKYVFDFLSNIVFCQ